MSVGKEVVIIHHIALDGVAPRMAKGAKAVQLSSGEMVLSGLSRISPPPPLTIWG